MNHRRIPLSMSDWAAPQPRAHRIAIAVLCVFTTTTTTREYATCQRAYVALWQMGAPAYWELGLHWSNRLRPGLKFGCRRSLLSFPFWEMSRRIRTTCAT